MHDVARSGQTSPRHYILTTNNTTITYDSPYLLLTSPWYGWPMYDAFSTLTSVPSTSGVPVRCVERSNCYPVLFVESAAGFL